MPTLWFIELFILLEKGTLRFSQLSEKDEGVGLGGQNPNWQREALFSSSTRRRRRSCVAKRNRPAQLVKYLHSDVLYPRADKERK